MRNTITRPAGYVSLKEFGKIQSALLNVLMALESHGVDVEEVDAAADAILLVQEKMSERLKRRHF